MKKNNENPYTIMLLTKDQINGLMYVLDCYLRTHKDDEFVRRAKKMKQKIFEYGRTFSGDKSESLSLIMFESDMITLIKLFSTYNSAIQEIPNDYYAEIVESQRAKAINQLNF